MMKLKKNNNFTKASRKKITDQNDEDQIKKI